MKDKKSFVQEKYLKNIRCQWNQQMIEKNSNHENYLSNSLGNNDCLMKFTTSGRRSRYSSIHSGLYWNRLNKYQLYLLYPEITYYLLPIKTYTFLINNKNQRDRNADNWSTYLKISKYQVFLVIERLKMLMNQIPTEAHTLLSCKMTIMLNLNGHHTVSAKEYLQDGSPKKTIKWLYLIYF
ncbi:hypothetical protein AGLY_017777 [Aphis glycines]|uniref:Uncharacterized protein n=1 Tax=Aphis glycines TaxID=307491 RepID=A0A6G0SUQ1_APHGL|nr:hypothetical protein AGLY_017777 [Aphis glycines]